MSKVIVVFGGAGPTGQAVVKRFRDLGDTVIAVDKTGADGSLAVDLLDFDAVKALAAEIGEEHGRVDGIVHLVGGWRGGKTFAGTKLEDWALLHDLLIRTLQHVTLAFEPLLRASADGRFAIVSAKAARNPTQGNAVYATAKAASEAWTFAFADALKDSSSAAAVLVVTALVNDKMRAANPDRAYTGFTDVSDLALALSGLWDQPAGEVNGRRIELA